MEESDPWMQGWGPVEPGAPLAGRRAGRRTVGSCHSAILQCSSKVLSAAFWAVSGGPRIREPLKPAAEEREKLAESSHFCSKFSKSPCALNSFSAGPLWAPPHPKKKSPGEWLWGEEKIEKESLRSLSRPEKCAKTPHS